MQSKDGVPPWKEDEHCSKDVERFEIRQQGLGEGGGRGHTLHVTQQFTEVHCM